jgi:hypothetical protein
VRRLSFVVATGSALLVPTIGRAAVDTVVAVNCNVDDLCEEAEDRLADALKERGVNVIAPEAMDVSVRVHARIVVQEWFGGGIADYSYFAEISRRYHASRALVADLELRASSLPYGEFTVNTVRSSCSYRCFNTYSKGLIAAGNFSGKGRSEDIAEAQRRALGEAVLALARSASPRLA